MEEAIFRAAVIQLFAEISNRWNAKKCDSAKEDSAKEEEGRPGIRAQIGEATM